MLIYTRHPPHAIDTYLMQAAFYKQYQTQGAQEFDITSQLKSHYIRTFSYRSTALFLFLNPRRTKTCIIVIVSPLW